MTRLPFLVTVAALMASPALASKEYVGELCDTHKKCSISITDSTVNITIAAQSGMGAGSHVGGVISGNNPQTVRPTEKPTGKPTAILPLRPGTPAPIIDKPEHGTISDSQNDLTDKPAQANNTKPKPQNTPAHKPLPVKIVKK